MTDPIRSGLAEYINNLRLRAGLSMDEFAKAVGYKGKSSLQRYTEGHDLQVLQPKIAAKLSVALYRKGTPPIEMVDLAPLVNVDFDGKDAVSETILAKILGLPEPSNAGKLGGAIENRAGRLPVVGSAHASFWMTRSPALDAAEDWLTIPFVNTKALSGQYALRIVGPSINRTAPDGHFAICEQFGNGTSSLPEGKFVHAERERRGETEWTLKRVKWAADGMILCPDSDHPDHQRPLRLSDGESGEEIVRIKGIVVGWYKPA